MTTKLKCLSLCILLMGVGACSSKDQPKSDSAVEGQTTESSEALQNITETPTVIVPKAQISPDQSWDKIDSDVRRSNLIYFYPEKMNVLNYKEPSKLANDLYFPENHEFIKKQLHLDKLQLLVIGMQGHNLDNDMLVDLSNDEYFKYANNLAINYIRALQVPKVEPKQEFEKTQDYEERVKQAQQNSLNNVIDYDTELLERALNYIAPDITSIGSEGAYQYDADKELMTINFEQKSRYFSSVVKSELIIKVAPDLAKTLADNFGQLKVGYVFTPKNNTLNLDGIFFYLIRYGNPDRKNNTSRLYLSPIIKPNTFKQKSAVNVFWKNNDAVEEVDTVPFKDVLTSPIWKFKFGLENYLSPESLLQKYVKPEIPKEPNELQYLEDG
ncbi:hypothetical protein D9K80_08195 [Acinetobacter cumulans]|uniref:Lipoprotein n=1 Tax=Acinetobacter cumulans TaxID=2136182 RepID=A0A498CWI0_9GAMM|nr:hypothetical protein [Acinetobacter cumulans]RLL35431.1 hypothetical protein D9K80_08195 [Acinetobacter cumulans]